MWTGHTQLSKEQVKERAVQELCARLQLISVSIRLRLTEAAALADDYILMHGRPKATQKPLWDPPFHPEALCLSPGS